MTGPTGFAPTIPVVDVVWGTRAELIFERAAADPAEDEGEGEEGEEGEEEDGLLLLRREENEGAAAAAAEEGWTRGISNSFS